ncbi:MAG: cellulose biosynthesis cyclic di-GMP-binding regulatory protein BcsB [Bacteroidota bacterium]
MKKIIRSFLYALVLASLLSSLGITVGSAAPSPQTVTGNQAVIRFDELGQTDNLMRGPYGTQNLRFGLPVNWSFKQGASLQLIITTSVVTSSSQAVADGQSTGATLNVTVDKQSIATVPLQAGSNVTYNVPIPGSALQSPLSDGRHEVILFLDAGNDCNNPGRQTSVVIMGASTITIPFSETEPAIDLTALPRPIFQRDSIFPVNVVMVIPDAPSAGEMQAALTVAASFGRMSGGSMALNLVPMSTLTPEVRTESELIFVGKSSSLSLLQGATLPSPLQGNKFTAPGMQQDDGLLQMAVSPWNTGRAILVVGGNTDAGVIKAAQALSSTNIQTVGDRSLAIIADVVPPASNGQLNSSVPQEMNTLGDLGYGILTMNGAGRSETSVRFNVPPGFVTTEDAYLDLTFNHSGLLDFNRSGLTVYMNGNLIGSLLLSQQTATTNTQRIKIPASSLTPNSNELRFQVDLAPLSQCSFLDTSNIWFSILPESVINLPLSQATADTAAPRDLGSYPYPFTGEPTLSNLNFVLPKNDPATWNTAAQIALQMGRQATGALFSPGAVFDGEIPDNVRNNSNMIVVGLPTKMKIFDELNKSLPAPFDPGTNVAVLKGQQVAYRFPADASLGFLQLMQSPWNSNNTIMTVNGTTPEGVQQAGNALIDSILRSRLKGNFVLVNNQTLSVADTRTGLGLAGVSADGNASAEIPVTSGQSNSTQGPNKVLAGNNIGWIPMVIGGLLVIIVVVMIIAALTRRRVVVNR